MTTTRTTTITTKTKEMISVSETKALISQVGGADLIEKVSYSFFSLFFFSPLLLSNSSHFSTTKHVCLLVRFRTFEPHLIYDDDFEVTKKKKDQSHQLRENQ